MKTWHPNIFALPLRTAGDFRGSYAAHYFSSTRNKILNELRLLTLCVVRLRRHEKSN
jgi:hypothetical protein